VNGSTREQSVSIGAVGGGRTQTNTDNNAASRYREFGEA
jgi:hypothetical protein